MINPISPYLHDYENMTNYISDSEDSSTEQALHPNQPIGDTLMPATPETLRIMFQNVNGINLDKDGGDFHSICKDLKTTDTDIMMIAEPNLCHRHYHVKDTLIRTASSNGIKFPKITLSSSQLKYRSYKKPGGTMILTHGKTGARVADQGTDAYGRWSWITVSGKLKSITVVALYHVGNSQDYLQAAKKGSKTFRLQLHIMGLNKRRNSSPRQQLLEDLTMFLETRLTKGESILLCGDFNEVHQVNSNSHQLASALNPVDLMDIHLGTQLFNTHQRNQSNQRIDFALASTDLSTSIFRAGYLPFGQYFKGDHRPFYIDFNIYSLIGEAITDIASPQKRMLNSKDKRNRARYIRAKYDELTFHNFFNRLNHLISSPTCAPGIAEQIDSDWTRASVYAEKQCHSHYEMPYVREIAQMRKEKRILSLICSQYANKIDMSRPIEHNLKAHPQVNIPATTEACKQRIAQLQHSISDKLKQAHHRRKLELQEELEARKSRGDQVGEKAVRNIIIAEETKQVNKQLSKLKDSYDSALSQIKVPDNEFADPKECSSWLTITSPEEMEKYLLERNRKHFGQARGTFPTVPPFSDLVDWAATTPSADLILQGDFDDETINDAGKLLIEQLESTTPLNSISANITEDEWIGKIKAWRESTSTSPSGIHLGHHKSLVIEFQEDDTINEHSTRWEEFTSQDSEDDDEMSLEDMRMCLLQAQLLLINYGIKHSYVFNRWSHVTNLMILKEVGNTKIHRLRVLHLYEADYNAILAIKSRQLIHHTIDNNLLHRNQYGGVPGRDSLTPVLITEMQNEITRLTRKPLISIDFDASSCYDRICANISSLTTRGYGQHQFITTLHAHHLRKAKYLLKTQLGLSDTHFSHSKLFPIYGVGQGSSASPTIWCLISCRLFEAHDKYCYGATFYSPDGSVSTKVSLLSFVDDCYGSINSFDNNKVTIEELLRRAEFDSQLWSQLLNSTGGALEVPKIKYHVIQYQFKPSGKPTFKLPTDQHRIEIDANDGNGSQEMKSLDPNQARKMLGCFKEPSGNNKASLESIKANAMTKATKVFNSHLDSKCVFRYYYSMFLPSVLYSFPANSISSTHLHLLTSKTTRLFLPKLGFNRNTAKAIIYGPTRFGGINMRNLDEEQGLAKIEHLTKHFRSKSTEASLHFQIALQWAQHTAGVSFPILKKPETPLPHLESVWFTNLRTFLATHNLSIEVEHPGIIPSQRQNDVFLMDIVIASGKFANHEIRRINYCRLYFNVTLISDITTANGLALRSEIYNGKSTMDRHSTTHQVYQEKPADALSWTLWRKACNLLIHHRQTKKLLQPLGDWTVHCQSLHQQHYLYSPTTTSIYRQTHQQWYKHQQHPLLPY